MLREVARNRGTCSLVGCRTARAHSWRRWPGLTVKSGCSAVRAQGASGYGRSAHCRRCCCSRWASWRCRCSTWRWQSPTPLARGSRVVLARTRSSGGCATRCRLCLNCARADCCLPRANILPASAAYTSVSFVVSGVPACVKGGWVELVCSYGPLVTCPQWAAGVPRLSFLTTLAAERQPDPLGSRLLL